VIPTNSNVPIRPSTASTAARAACAKCKSGGNCSPSSGCCKGICILHEAALPPAFSGSLSPFPFTVHQLPLLPPIVLLPPSSQRAAPSSCSAGLLPPSLLQVSLHVASTFVLAHCPGFCHDVDPTYFRPSTDPVGFRPRRRSGAGADVNPTQVLPGVDLGRGKQRSTGASRGSPRLDLAEAHFFLCAVVDEASVGSYGMPAAACTWQCSSAQCISGPYSTTRRSICSAEPRRFREDYLRLIHAARTASCSA
jgi:hypothetical protein